MSRTIVIGVFVVLFIIMTFVFVISRANLPYYQYYDLMVKLFAGIAPFVAAFGAYYMWSQNREKELKEMDYKNAHYKKLVDKRLEAYQNLCDFISKISIRNSAIIPDNTEYFLSCFRSVKKLNTTLNECLELGEYRYWYSKEVKSYLDKINKIIAKECTYFNTHKNESPILYDINNKPSDSVVRGIKRFDELSQYISSINKSISDDYKTIDNIPLFFQKK